MNEGATRVLGIALFVIMGASALVLGVMNTKQGITGPLKINPSASSGLSEEQQMAALKSKDTDGDGLSDYDELYVYHTSPYISDSDSDGIPDGQEVKDGTDPNCPKGQDCGTPAPVNSPTSSSSALDLLNISPSSLMGGADNGNSAGAGTSTVPSGLSGENGSIPKASPGNVGQIRQMLKDQGLTDDMLSAIDDATLIQMYNDSIAAAQANANVNAKQ